MVEDKFLDVGLQEDTGLRAGKAVDMSLEDTQQAADMVWEDTQQVADMAEEDRWLNVGADM